jgi:hypothetical protein
MTREAATMSIRSLECGWIFGGWIFILPCLLALAPDTQPAAPVENLLTNGGFEQAMDGWDTTKDEGMSLVAPEAAHTGTSGLRVSDEDGNKGSSLGSSKAPAKPGRTYAVKFWARIMSGKDASVYIQFFDDKDKQINKSAAGNLIQIRVKGEEWKQYSGTGVAPENAATVRVWVHTGNAAKAIADFDDFVLSEAAP